MFERIGASNMVNGLRRLKLSSVPAEMPPVPDTPVRKKPGLFGQFDTGDLAHQNRMNRYRQKVVEGRYIQKGAGVLAHSIRENTVAVVREMEQADQALELGTLHEEVGEVLTETSTQALAQSGVAILNGFIEESLANFRRG